MPKNTLPIAPTPGKVTPSMVATTTLGVWPVGCVHYGSEEMQTLSLSNKSCIWDTFPLILLPSSRSGFSFRGTAVSIRVRHDSRRFLYVVSALSVVWSMGHLQIWDWWLSALLAGGVSWGPALHQPSFLFLLLRRLLVPLCWGYFKQSQGPMTVLWRSPHPPGAGCGRDRRGPEDFVGSLSPVWIQADCKMKCRYQGSWHEGSASPAQHLCSSYHLDFLAQAVSSATCFMPQFLFWGRSHLVLAPFSAL